MSVTADPVLEAKPKASGEGVVMTFCIGAQKSGTTSLHKILKSHPDCRLRYAKEIGFFSRDGDSPKALKYFDTQIKRLQRQIDGPGAAPWHKAAQKDFKRARHLVKTGDVEGFRAFMFANARPGQVVGDFSPGYAMKDEATFQRMRDFHDDVRILFMMRDPVERAWSNARHLVRVKGAGTNPEDVQRAAETFLRDALENGNTGFDLRCDYARTIELVLKVFAQDKAGFFLFEEVFGAGQSGLDPVYDFLGLKRVETRLRVVNKGLDASLPDDLRDALRAHLSGQYDYVTGLLGRTPTGWGA